MTTILADAKLGVMVSDSRISDGDRVWSGRKVWRHDGHLIGVAGVWSSCLAFVDWFKSGRPAGVPVNVKGASMIVLAPQGLILFDDDMMPQVIESGREAIGSGAKAAMCAYEALGWTDPARAVRIVCRHDASSGGPVRTYRLASRQQQT